MLALCSDFSVRPFGPSSMQSSATHVGVDTMPLLAPPNTPSAQEQAIAPISFGSPAFASRPVIQELLSRNYSSSSDDPRATETRTSSRESNSNASGNTEREAGVEGDGVPRRQRGIRRRLSFPAKAAPPEKRREVERRGIERRTSGIYDLIDAIGLLDAQSMSPALPLAEDGEVSGGSGTRSGGSNRGSSESHQQACETHMPSIAGPGLEHPDSAHADEEEPAQRAAPGSGGVRKRSASRGCAAGSAGGAASAGRAAGCDTSARDSSRLGSWSSTQKVELVRLVREHNPCGAADWEAIAGKLGRWSRGGASAERMYRTLTDPGYHRATNKHGRRLNKRGGTPMHVMAAHALRQLPGMAGNLTQISDVIKEHPAFARHLDWSARPGTKTYPRWKDALIGCFKAGRYPHLVKTERKHDGLNVYQLDERRTPPAVAAAAERALAAAAAGEGGDPGAGGPDSEDRSSG